MIGPIGEDLPALFPIVFSLLLFLLTLYHGLTTISKLDKEAKLVNTSIEIANRFTKYSSIDGKIFGEICNHLKEQYQNFRIRIVKEDLENYVSGYSCEKDIGNYDIDELRKHFSNVHVERYPITYCKKQDDCGYLGFLEVVICAR
jgi:hypothetical protein